MYVDGNRCRLAHTEVRSAIGSVSTEDGILYSHGRSITVVGGYSHEETTIEKLFGIVGTSEKSYHYDDRLSTPNELSTKLTQVLEASSFRPEIFIDKDFLTTSTGYVKNRYIQSETTTLFDKDDLKNTDDYMEEYFDNYCNALNATEQVGLAEQDADPLEQNKDGVYIANPHELDNLDREILTDQLREELCEVGSIHTQGYLFSERTIQLKPENEIWRLARLHGILTL